jgi:hypothetical protein
MSTACNHVDTKKVSGNAEECKVQNKFLQDDVVSGGQQKKEDE